MLTNFKYLQIHNKSVFLNAKRLFNL